MAGLKLEIKRRYWAFRRYWKRKPFIIGWDDYLAITIALFGVVGFINGPIPFVPGWTEAYHQIRAELIGIGISVLIIANANEAIKTREDKKRLILQMGSPDNALAKEAVRQLQSKHWLWDGTLQRAYLSGAKLSLAHLNGADLRRADLTVADLSGAQLREADLRGAYLEGADLSGSYLRDANFRKASLIGVRLIGADLSGANFSQANLWLANLRGASLPFLSAVANFHGADLRSADLRDVYMVRVSLRGAKFDSHTQWPADFDPDRAGAINID